MSKRILTLVSLLVALAWSSRSVCAQVKLPIAEGDRIRIHYDTTVEKNLLPFIHVHQKETRKVTGQFAAIVRDSIVITDRLLPGGFCQHAVDGVKRLDVSLGKKRATWKGLLYGAGTGATIAVVAIGAPTILSDEDFIWDRKRDALGGIAVMTVAGAVLGCVIGSLIHEDRWQKVDREHWSGRIRLSIDPIGRAVTLTTGL